jgi:hypothetical protein
MFTLSYNVNSKVHRVREKKEVDAFFSWFMSVLPGCLEEYSRIAPAAWRLV